MLFHNCFKAIPTSVHKHLSVDATQHLENVNIDKNFSFMRVHAKRLTHLKRAQNSIQCFHNASRLMADRPGVPDKAFTHVCGHFGEDFISRAREISQSGGGWRLRSDPVSQMLTQAKAGGLLLFSSVIFCDHFGVKFVWGMLLTNLKDESCHLLLNDNPFSDLPPQLFDVLKQVKLVTLDLSCSDLEIPAQ